ADLRLTQARILFQAHPDGGYARHGAPVHHQAVRWRRPHDEAVLHASFNRRSDRPSPGHALTAVRVNRKAADRLLSARPWIFSSDVTERGGAAPGDVVQVFDHKGRPLGVAHYSSSSQICLRLLSSRIESVDTRFFEQRLSAAAEYRRAIVCDSDAYRLVH